MKVKLKEEMLIFLAMVYVFFKLVCNPLFFRDISIYIPIFQFAHKTTASALTFPMIYIMSDIIFMLTNRRDFTFMIVVWGIMCDGIFSAIISYFAIIHNGMNAPVVVYGPNMIVLFVNGVIGTLISSLCELLIFSYLFKKSKIFFWSTIISMGLVLFIHNFTTDYYVMQGDYDKIRVIFNNTIAELIIIATYLLCITLFVKVIKVKYIFKRS